MVGNAEYGRRNLHFKLHCTVVDADRAVDDFVLVGVGKHTCDVFAAVIFRQGSVCGVFEGADDFNRGQQFELRQELLNVVHCNQSCGQNEAFNILRVAECVVGNGKCDFRGRRFAVLLVGLSSKALLSRFENYVFKRRATDKCIGFDGLDRGRNDDCTELQFVVLEEGTRTDYRYAVRNVVSTRCLCGRNKEQCRFAVHCGQHGAVYNGVGVADVLLVFVGRLGHVERLDAFAAFECRCGDGLQRGGQRYRFEMGDFAETILGDRSDGLIVVHGRDSDGLGILAKVFACLDAVTVFAVGSKGECVNVLGIQCCAVGDVPRFDTVALCVGKLHALAVGSCVPTDKCLFRRVGFDRGDRQCVVAGVGDIGGCNVAFAMLVVIEFQFVLTRSPVGVQHGIKRIVVGFCSKLGTVCACAACHIVPARKGVTRACGFGLCNNGVADCLKLFVYAAAARGVERKRVGVHFKRCPLAVFVGKAKVSYLQFVYAGLVERNGCVGCRSGRNCAVVYLVLVGSRVGACRPGKQTVGIGKTRHRNAGLGAVYCVSVAPQRLRLVLEHGLYLDFVLSAKDNVVTFERKLVCVGCKHLCADLHFVGGCAFDSRPSKHALT